MKPRRITFGEQIEIAGIKDEIADLINNPVGNNSVLITCKLRKIGRISKMEANKTITELKLNELGYKKLDLRKSENKDKDKRLRENRE